MEKVCPRCKLPQEGIDECEYCGLVFHEKSETKDEPRSLNKDNLTTCIFCKTPISRNAEICPRCKKIRITKRTIFLVVVGFILLFGFVIPKFTEQNKDQSKTRIKPSPEKVVSNDLSNAGEGCYKLGYRFGLCATKSMNGIPCKPENDIVIPERCRGNDETNRGMKVGVREVTDTFNLDTKGSTPSRKTTIQKQNKTSKAPISSQSIKEEIAAFAKRQYPHDSKMQKYVYQKQTSAYKYMLTVNDSDVKEIALRSYPDDYSMQKYIYKKQLSAKHYMKKVGNKEIKRFALKSYSHDYSMQQYVYNKQLTAKLYMETVSNSAAKSKAQRSYPYDYSMQKYIYDKIVY